MITQSTDAETRILEVFPPGRARRILFWLAKHQHEVDDLRYPKGELLFELGAYHGEGVVRTSGIQWSPQEITFDD